MLPGVIRSKKEDIWKPIKGEIKNRVDIFQKY